MSIIQAMPPFPDNFTTNSKIKVENAVAGVIFGLNTPPALIDIIRERISTAKPSISFKQVYRDPQTFNRQLRDFR